MPPHVDNTTFFSTSSEPPNLPMFAADLGLCLVGVVLLLVFAYLIARLPIRRLFARIENGIASILARTNAHTILACGICGFAVAMTVAFTVRQPEPQIHDEFSYLLAADTFARGRLTNPPPPNGSAFESMHIIVRPTYMSKYPPGQGLSLAVGELLGDPIVGLWLGAGLACASLCWCILAFVPRRLALTIGLLAAFHPLILKWGQSFWGGYVALIGGAILVGAAERIRHLLEKGETEPPSRTGSRIGVPILLALGVAILANSRLYEGAVMALIVLVPLFLSYRNSVLLWRVVVPPFVAALSIVAVWMAYYNFRITGNPLVMPYVIHENLYGVAPLFLWQSLKPVPVTLRHESMRAVGIYFAVQDFHAQHDTLQGVIEATCAKADMLLRAPIQLFDLTVYRFEPVNTPPIAARLFRYAPILTILFGGGYIATQRTAGKARAIFWRIFLSLTVFVACLLPETYMHPHYAAPAGGMFAALVAVTWQHLQVMTWNKRRMGGMVVSLVSLLLLVSFSVNLAELKTRRWNQLQQDRRPVINHLLQLGGKHLVLVDYGKEYGGGGEWVYNGADLENATIVWARYLTPQENRLLLSHYTDRHIWRLYVDRFGIKLRPITVTK